MRIARRSWLASLALAAWLPGGGASVADKPGFVPLFNGRDLTGWHTLPGGTWEVRDGAIVGRSPQAERRHGLLVSDARYSDFTLRVRFKVTQGNSGLYFRSEEVAGDVGVNGFQAEVDNSKAVGGLYETGGRGWVTKPPAPVIEENYTPGEWATMEIRAAGPNVTVLVNGRETSRLENDPGRRTGVIALQLHGGMDMEVAFKDVEIRIDAP
jgi:hypothetical protein